MATPIRHFKNNYYYHIYNRGVDKAEIYFDSCDYDRFLKSLVFYQQEGPQPPFSLSRFEIKNRSDNIKFQIIAYCLMPNHFHLLLQQTVDNGIMTGIGNLLNSYTKYINTKYTRVGPLFQSRFQSLPVTSDEQLLHLSRYIVLNPYVGQLIHSPEKYVWSSLKELFRGNSGSPTICNDKILYELLSTNGNIKKFVLDHADFARSRKNILQSFPE